MAELVIKLANGELAGKTMQEITKQINAAATAANKAKVGTQEWVDAHKNLDAAKKLQADLKTQIDSTKKASDGLKTSFLDMIPFGGHIKSIVGQMASWKSGVGGLISSMGLLKTALISTGLGALVVLLGSLVAWFQKTERGADFLAKASAALGAAWSVLVDRGSKLIDALIALSQGKFTEAANKFGEATKNVTAEIVLETKAAWELADALDNLEEQESKMILVRSRTKDQIAELRLQAKDESLSMAERAKALEQAIILTRQLANQEEQIARQRAVTALGFATEAEVLQHYGVTLDELIARGEDIINTDNLGLSESLQGDVTAAFEALAKLSDVRKQGADEERTIITELNTLKRKDRKEDDQALKDQQKAEQDALKAREAAWDEFYNSIKELEDAEVQAMEDSREKDLAQLQLSLDRQIEALDKNSILYSDRVAAAEELARQKRDEINKKWDAKELNDQILNLELKLEADNNELIMRFLNREINEQQFAQLTAERTLQYEQQRLDIIKKSHGEQSIEYQRAYGEFLQHQKAYADESAKTTKQLADEQLANTVATLGVMAGFMGSLAGLYEQGTMQYKAFATAQAIISTIQGAINAYTSASAISPFLGAIAAAAALAAGYARVRQIENTKLPSPVKKDVPKKDVAKKERGGLLSGRRHSQGGILIEAEDGEFIFSREATAAIGARHLSNVNDYFTQKFEAGGPINPFPQSAAPSGAGAPSIPGTGSEFSVLKDELRSLGSKLDSWPTRLKVINVVTETEEGIKTINQIRSDADV